VAGGAVRVRRIVCAVDCGTVVNPDTVQAQIQSAIIFGITAALYGKITVKDGPGAAKTRTRARGRARGWQSINYQT
jgi:CO/xanthine dehydrogenase Mo-binding subunit